jgi:hypothetical protein
MGFSGGGGFVYVLGWLVVLAVVILFRAFLLLFRAADRSARIFNRALQSAARSRFGDGGPPDEIARRLRERHPELSKGTGTGLTFACSGRRGRLDFISDLTEIRFALDGQPKESLEVSTPSFISQLAEDDPDAFRVRGSDALYREVFKDPALLKMLRDWHVSFEWSVRPTEFFLLLRSQPRDEEELWRWLKGAFALLQSLPGVGAESAIQLTRASTSTLAESSCQVCGSGLGQGTVVYCVRCATPHHDECWTYAGQCSTFACREDRYSR